MVKKRTLTPLPIFDQTALPAFLREHSFKEVHALNIWRHLAQNPTHSFRQIPHLSKKLAELLELHFAHFTTTLTAEQRSKDGTVKLLLKLQDGHEIEAVIMKHTGRNTLCVSSQVGCQMGCTFCATGTMGIIADLWSGEILEQLAFANTVAPIRNVVFMGMGEPLNNYDAVLQAIKAMTSVFGLAPKHITLSTVGVIHRIRQLTKDAPLVRLALSLHAPTQEMRTEIVPTSKAYPLDKLMQAIDEHLAIKEGRLVMVEYCMLEGVNDSIETAHILGKLLQGRSVHVNLIPYNTTDVGAQFRSPSPEAIREFHSVLREPYNLKATIRENHGTDIDGACGQLALKNKGENGGGGEQKDIEDIGIKTRASKKKVVSPKKKQSVTVAEDETTAAAASASPAVAKSVLDTVNEFVDRHQQAVGLALLGASAVVLAIGFARRARAHA
ncbi:23S rrna methyltransferase [Globisporangium polare]